MKTLFYFPKASLFAVSFLISLFNFFSKAQINECYFEKDVKPKDVLIRLFDAQWNNKELAGKWKPNWGEMQDFGTSYDGYLYTSVDTFFLVSKNNERHFLIIANTRKKEDETEYESCHSCGGTISIIDLAYDKNELRWHVDFFRKYAGSHGSWGNSPGYELFDLWDGLYAVGIEDGFSSGGSNTGWLVLYLNGMEIFHETMYDDNGASGLRDSELYSYEKKLIIDKKNKAILIKAAGTVYDEKLKKVVPFNRTFVYKFNSEGKLTRDGR